MGIMGNRDNWASTSYIMNKSSKIGSLCCAAILLATLNANATLIDILGQLGEAGKYAVFSLTGTAQDDSKVTINGDVGVGPNGSASVGAPSTINGTLYKDPTATVTGPGLITGGIVTTSLQQGVNDAIAASTFFDGLAATQTFTSISTATTIAGNGGNNIIDLSGGITLGGTNNLTLSGNANDRFIFNISGGLGLTGSASVVLTGGVVAQNVVFNFIGTGSALTADVGNLIQGVVLATQRDLAFHSVSGAVIGGGATLALSSGAVVTGFPAVPETTPGSVIFGFLGLVVAVSSRKAIAARARARKSTDWQIS
jgi:hypothetical protein